MISDLDRIMAKERAMAKLRSEMESHGPIVHNDGPIVHNENVGGGANGTIDGGAGNEAVGGGEGAVGGEKSGDSSSTNGGTFYLPFFTYSWISFQILNCHLIVCL